MTAEQITIIEVDSLLNLVQYFQNIYAQTSDTGGIKGIIIIEMQSNSRISTNTFYVQNNAFRSNEQLNEIRLFSCKQCCVYLFILFAFLL